MTTKNTLYSLFALSPDVMFYVMLKSTTFVEVYFQYPKKMLQKIPLYSVEWFLSKSYQSPSNWEVSCYCRYVMKKRYQRVQRYSIPVIYSNQWIQMDIVPNIYIYLYRNKKIFICNMCCES
jgi:hypothetical protein